MRYDRAQSESIGVVLLTGIIVIAIGGSSVVLFGVAGDDGSAELADLQIEATTSGLTVEHVGGDAVAMGDSAVIVRGETIDARYTIDAANVTGDGDGRFEPGERFERAHGSNDDAATILVVDTDADEVMARATLDLKD